MELVTCYEEWVTCYEELVTCYEELTTRCEDFATWGSVPGVPVLRSHESPCRTCTWERVAGVSG